MRDSNRKEPQRRSMKLEEEAAEAWLSTPTNQAKAPMVLGSSDKAWRYVLVRLLHYAHLAVAASLPRLPYRCDATSIHHWIRRTMRSMA